MYISIGIGYSYCAPSLCFIVVVDALWNPGQQANWPSATAMPINTLRPRQNGRHFTDAIFKDIFLNENVWIPIKFSLKFFPKGPINNIPALVQIMAWRRPSDKPFSERMIVSLPTHICITQPQRIKFWPQCRMYNMQYIQCSPDILWSLFSK